MKKERGEEHFTYTLNTLRPRLSHLRRVNNQGGGTDVDTEEEKAEVARWEAEHPEPREEPTEKRVQVWATRGTDSYGPRIEDRTSHIKGLLERFSWIELRKAGDYLVDDGTNDAEAHL